MVADAEGKKTYRVGFFVLVEVDAFEGEAVLTADAACNWPGDWSPPQLPTLHYGQVMRTEVQAKVIRSQALMIKEVDDG